MVGWHQRLDAPELESAPGDAEGQGGLARCRPQGPEKLDTTKRLSKTQKRTLLYQTASCLSDGDRSRDGPSVTHTGMRSRNGNEDRRACR